MPGPRWSVDAIRPGERPIVRRLVELYLYDLGGERWGVGPDGRFAADSWHQRFWGRDKRHFLIRVEGRIAGFALVGDRAEFAGPGVWEISEFFVLRKYRRRGVGAGVARSLFGRFPGRWETAELVWNVTAQRFWRRVIGECAARPLVERRRRNGDLAFVVQHFEVSERAADRAGRERSPTSPARHPSGSRPRSTRTRRGR